MRSVLAIALLAACSGRGDGYCDEFSKCVGPEPPIATVTLLVDGAPPKEEQGVWRVGTVPDGTSDMGACVGGSVMVLEETATLLPLTLPSATAGVAYVHRIFDYPIIIDDAHVKGTLVLEHWYDGDAEFSIPDAVVCLDDDDDQCTEHDDVTVLVQGDWLDMGELAVNDKVWWTLEDGTPLCAPEVPDLDDTEL